MESVEGCVGASGVAGSVTSSVGKECTLFRSAFADVFRRIVICSGPRDAINVYFHSDAHVVFPHSESVEISSETIRRLLNISMEVFVLYDIDRTGIRTMNLLALKHVELKVLYLPEDLSTQYNPRSGKT